MLHPDQNPGDTRANDAFAHLSELWAQYNGKVTTPKTTATIFSTRRHDFVLGDLIDRGDIANIYRVEGSVDVAALKMPRNPKYNDFIVNEITSLKYLKENVHQNQLMYFPETVDSFAHRDSVTGKTRRSIVTNYLDGFVNLRDVMNAYPQGISGRHVAWIARRLWVALELAHSEADLIHGAVFPEHVMIHPTMHGVVLVDWGYSREKGAKLTSAVPRYLDAGWYGGRYDQPLDHRLDVRQAAHTLESLLGEQGARPFRAFFNGCRVASAPTAGELFDEFEELLTRVYGKRSYVPFEMPQGWKRAV